ncbi:bifunctional folylpolyglutamate synthase/dihydrofolate synthase [Bombella favorum]|uniref:Bifunctional folylpolyglutamate synthase/dihydrofolate synthase n=1 Tax=Bombella favorum TaxID=2039164 RepID=A0ABR5ZMP7_9PROT|nr:folylpolyglutamate synthase/dihydrofolate synthase family protein [Bombella favorum]MBA5725598.1 bifunctional folylpolyglutamate synthase/dihydrofolate synthase [Bombella favorum]
MATGQHTSAPQSEFHGRTGAIVRRLQELHPKLIDLSLDRLEILLARLGHPERALPPTIHVAGTNGKGSTCANLRAIGEAAGLRVHVMTSPHLLDVTERFRLAGQLVSEDQFVATLEEIERVNDGAPITVFEVLTAAGFLLFSRIPADLLILEVGLGGRFDATNVIPTARACIITSISLDHQGFLGDDLAGIAREKAGIIKQNVPVFVAPQPADVMVAITEVANTHAAPLHRLGHEFTITPQGNGLLYQDEAGSLTLPAPSLHGPHQAQNSALAVAALRHAGLSLPDSAFAGIAKTHWPARLQTLHGILTQDIPANWELLLDGGHNPGAGTVLADVLKTWQDQPLHLIVGLKDSKDVQGFLRPLIPYATTIQAVAEEGQHLAMPVQTILEAAKTAGGTAQPGPDIRTAIKRLRDEAGATPKPARILICGSLYLAGCALALDGASPH